MTVVHVDTLLAIGVDVCFSSGKLRNAFCSGARSQARNAVRPGSERKPAALLAIIVRSLPEHGIVVDESVSSGREFFRLTAAAAPHDYLQLTDGLGIPMATYAAIAAPSCYD